MDQFNLFKELIKKASEARGIKEYEVYYNTSSDIGADTYQNEINTFSSSVGAFLTYRCIVDGKIGYASTEYMDESEMEPLVDRAVQNTALIEKTDKPIIYGGAPKEAYHETNNPEFSLPTAAEIKDAVMEYRDIVYATDPMVTDGTSCQVFASCGTSHLYNSNGLDLTSSGGTTAAIAMAVLAKDEERLEGYDYLCNKPNATKEEKEAFAKQVVDGVKMKFGAGKVKTGKYNVIFDGKQMRSILSTFLSVFYADSVQKGLSLLKGKVGEKIAADCVTITDDPFYPGNPRMTSFDGEGVPTRTKNVIENGVLKTFLYNLTTADKDGVETTGNASRSVSSIGTRVYTFYLNPGDCTKDELLQKAGNGIYINEMKGFHAGANAVTGDFSIESAGFLIEDGKLTAPIKSFTVAGNFFDLLKQITAIDNDLQINAPGYTVASPNVLVPNMSVAGE